MKVSASNIISWVENNNKIAQQELPQIIRRLCFHAKDTKAISFPAGDSTFMPSWDGTLESADGNAWIPAGKSVWEIGTDNSVGSKANSDFIKRTKDSSEELKAENTYIFITPRRWKGKEKWVTDNKDKGGWKEIRAYDATDLEEWIDTQPSNAVYIAEVLGISGYGVKSTEAYFNDWASQCKPVLTKEALTLGRESSFELLEKNLFDSLVKDDYLVISVYSDSIEESVISAIVTVMNNNKLLLNSLVITDEQGWQYVQNNPEIKIVICASPEIAKQPSVKDNLTLIAPQALGNKSANKTDIVIERASYSEFEKALVLLGEEASDVTRLSKQIGRSWTVYRRLKAINSAIFKPDWSKDNSLALSLLSLIGSWDGNNANDKAFVSSIAKTEYKNIESELLQLASVDDTPVIKINQVWKIKSPVEVLPFVSNAISSELVERYFDNLLELFSIQHPKLELDVSQRYIANIIGKQFPYSEVLLEGISNSLIKLAVIGDDFIELSSTSFQFRINRLIKEILSSGSRENWLTLEPYFRSFAEASPEEFLGSIEKDLRKENPLIQTLFTESSSDVMTGQRYFNNLLWAFEVLAWNTRYITRVCKILIELDKFIVPSNWTNSPFNTLYSFFRPWFPQTNTTVEQRIELLNQIITLDEEIGFKILLRQRDLRGDHAIPNAQPVYRDDNAGHIVLELDRYKAIEYANEKLVDLANLNPDRIYKILELYLLDSFDLWQKVLKLLDELAKSEIKDDVRIRFQNKLRQFKNRNPRTSLKSEEVDQQLDHYIELFKPQSIVNDCLWLFTDRADSFFKRDSNDYDYKERQKIGDQKRVEAITAINENHGEETIFELLAKSESKRLCSAAIIHSKILLPKDIIDLLIRNIDLYDLSILDSIVWSEGSSKAITNFKLIMDESNISSMLNNEDKVSLLLNLPLPLNKDVWDTARLYNLEDEYWDRFSGYLAWIGDIQDKEYCVGKLIERQRPVALLNAISLNFTVLPVEQLLQTLELFINNPEDQYQNFDSHAIKEMIEYLEEKNGLDESRLVHIEYHLFSLFGYDEAIRLKTLYRNIMNDPNFFVQLLQSFFLKDNDVDKQDKPTALHNYKILDECAFLPSINKDLKLNEPDFKAFIKEVRAQSEGFGILDSCDRLLGRILSHSPCEDDDKSILTMVADVLDLFDAENIRRGFGNGIVNQRGAHWRDKGGKQERALADKYRQYAKPWVISHPHVSQMFEDIARSYESEAKYWDNQDKLMSENLR